MMKKGREGAHAGKPHTQFNESERTSAKPTRGSLFCKKVIVLFTMVASALMSVGDTTHWITVVSNSDSVNQAAAFKVGRNGCAIWGIISGWP